MAMLSRAAEKVGLVWNPPPRPDPSRLDEWFLGGGRAGSQRPPPVAFFPEVHEELTRSCKAPFTARNKSCGSSALTTLDGGAALGYTGIPLVERSVAMQLCPTAASTLRGDPCLPSRACKYSSGLTGSAYRACGEAASALHAMALLQVHQAKALRDLHEGGHDLAVLHELRAATDLALWATKVTAQSLGRAMSTLVVQERHLWLCLADMKEQEKVQFLNAPVSQTGLFGDALESFAQQFSAAQKQTEAIKHIMRRRKPAASTPAAAPQPARRRGRPSAAAPAPAQPSTRQRRGAGCRQDAQPVQAPAKPGGKRRCKRPWDGRPRDGGHCSSGDGDRTTPSPGGGPGGESFVSFCFCSAAGPAASGTQNINKRAVSSISGSQEEESGEPCITGSLPPSSLAMRQVVAKSTPPAHSWNQVRGGSTPVPASSRHTPGCHKPQAGFLCFLPHEEESGECYTTHPDPPPAITGQAVTGPGPGPCVPPRCPTVGTSVAPLVPLARSLGAWLALPGPSRWLMRTIRLGYAIQFARRPPKFRGVHFTSVKAVDAPVLCAEIAVLLAKDAIELVPPADMRSGFYSPYFIVPKKSGGLRPILDLRVLNRALHKLPFKMMSQKRIFGCVRALDWFAAIDLKDAYFHVSILPRHRPFLRFAFEGRAYQYISVQLAPGPAQICVPPSEPTSTDTVQDQGGRGAGLVSGSILAQQDLVPGTHAPRDSPSLADSSEEGSAFSETGHPPAPASRLVETPCVVPGRDAEVLGDLPQEVALTIASARAPSTRRAYALKWNLFVEWCSSHREDPRRCSIRAVLSFLQQGLERRLSPSTRAGQYIACDMHAHLVSKAGSLISAKSPSPVFKWSGI